jgi:CRISPR type III-B/RAMP module-associated protein Cmr3
MNTILLQPTDVLFFRDGRPMMTSLAGHGAAWPLPNVISAAFHAALHRAKLAGVHSHWTGERGIYASNAARDRKFGSLVTAGPFPVCNGRWYFPRPCDLVDGTVSPDLMPDDGTQWRATSSLPKPLEYATVNRLEASKDHGAKAWVSKEAFEAYLRQERKFELSGHAVDDVDFCDTEHTIGIEIDPKSGTAGSGEAEGKIYSAQYLRLRDEWQMGVCAQAANRENGGHNGDLVKALIDGTNGKIVIGGQQRFCTATRLPETTLALPSGLGGDFQEHKQKYLLKWVLISPAVWPEIPGESKEGMKMTPHPGGWLPNWVHPDSGKVLLRHRKGIRRDYSGAKARRVAESDEPIAARLVAAIVPKPVVVTGWALPNEFAATNAEKKGGAQSTHLAVPAGAVYYFEAESARDAAKLAEALNWHGDGNGNEIKNRRSALLGEKGFGLGVCGTWNFKMNGEQR